MLSIQPKTNNINREGSALLKTLLRATQREGITIKSLTGPKQPYSFDSYDESNDMPLHMAADIIYRVIPQIFKVDCQFNQHFKPILSTMEFVSNLLDPLWSQKSTKKTREIYLKYVAEYNKLLNIIQTKLRTAPCTPDIEAKRDLIRSMSLLSSVPFVFKKSACLSSIACLSSSTSCLSTSTSTSTSTTCLSSTACLSDLTPEENTRFMNYDGYFIPTSCPIRMNIPTSQHKSGDTQKKTGGLKFGFDTPEDVYTMLCAAIDTSTSYHLKKTELQQPGGGIVRTPCGFYHIELLIRHGDADGILTSSDTKLLAFLTNDNHKHRIIFDIIDKIVVKEDKQLLQCPGTINAIGLYLEFHMKVQAKIMELINESSNNPDFPLQCIDCYRPDCGHVNVFKKSSIRETKRCMKCNRAEFCMKCTKSSHGGDCDKLDEACIELIRSTTKKCPRCAYAIEKNDGCNHMSCRCGAHFCWLCNQIYTRNEINDHYPRNSPFSNTCIGLINQASGHNPPLAPQLAFQLAPQLAGIENIHLHVIQDDNEDEDEEDENRARRLRELLGDVLNDDNDDNEDELWNAAVLRIPQHDP